MNKGVGFLFLWLFIGFSVGAQQTPWSRTSEITTGYHAVKESANFGLVFAGANLQYGMRWVQTRTNRLLSYEYDLGVGILFSKDIPALGFYLKPLDGQYLFKVTNRNNSLWLGPTVKAVYSYNLYPDLQSGFDYWFTNFSLGVGAFYTFPYQQAYITLRGNTSLFGMVARQPAERNPHYYELGLNYAFQHLHQNLEFGAVDTYLSTNLEILYIPQQARLSFGYEFLYAGYYEAPAIHMISHHVKLIFHKK